MLKARDSEILPSKDTLNSTTKYSGSDEDANQITLNCSTDMVVIGLLTGLSTEWKVISIGSVEVTLKQNLNDELTTKI